MNILIIRFRQMGDAILATPLFNTLRATFPDARIDLVLNRRIAPLFEGHPSIDHIHTFTEEERHRLPTYLRKVWRTVHGVRYDAIIDMRSTLNTQLFSLFSITTPYRIGLDKSYTRFMSNCLVRSPHTANMVDHNLSLAGPLATIRPLAVDRRITLPIRPDEVETMRRYLGSMGVDFGKKLVMMGVTAKLSYKVWDERRMTDIIDRFAEKFPDTQILFNYAPGQEEENARRIFHNLRNSGRVLIDIQAGSPRELHALAYLVDFYFGNEGGARHIVHAAGKPSFVICSPGSLKSVWIPQDSVPAGAVSASDIADTAGMTDAEMYDCITTEYVWEHLCQFIDQHHIAL